MMNNSNDACTRIDSCMPRTTVPQMLPKIASTVRRVALVSVCRTAGRDIRATTPPSRVGCMRYTVMRPIGITTVTHAVTGTAPSMRVQVLRQAWPQTHCPAEASVGGGIGPHMGSAVGEHIASPVARSVGTSTCGIPFCVAYRGVCVDVAVAMRHLVWRNVRYRAATTTRVHACASVEQRIGEPTVRDFPAAESSPPAQTPRLHCDLGFQRRPRRAPAQRARNCVPAWPHAPSSARRALPIAAGHDRRPPALWGTFTWSLVKTDAQ